VRVAGPGDLEAGTIRLRGTIPAVADALPADVLLVPAEGVPNAIYLVEATAPGVHRTPVVSLDMTRQLCDISLDDAPARQIAVAAAAEAAVDAGLTAGAAVLAAEQLGLAQRCLDMTVGYLKERRQFARPIGSFQALKHLLADTSLLVEMAKGLVAAAAGALGRGADDGPAMASIARAFVSERSVEVTHNCFQVFGGVGYTWEHDQHLFMRRLASEAYLFGGPAWHRQRLWRHAVLPGAASGGGGGSDADAGADAGSDTGARETAHA
jgi:alkylation response protein AidB-like acyl-CoA dehydrogenase